MTLWVTLIYWFITTLLVLEIFKYLLTNPLQYRCVLDYVWVRVCLCFPLPAGGFPGGSDGKESACNAGDPGSIPVLGRSPGEGNGNPHQYSCLENSMDKEAWWATDHGVAKESDKTERLSLSLSMSGIPPQSLKQWTESEETYRKLSFQEGGSMQRERA